jgi:hypothetical protein
VALALVGVAVACFVFRNRRQSSASAPAGSPPVELQDKAPAVAVEEDSLGVSISDSE